MPQQFPTLIQRLNAIEKPVTAKTLAGLLGVSHITIYKQGSKRHPSKLSHRDGGSL